MDKVSLTASMRSNLLSLQNISRQVDATQNRLSTGKKVNSAIDNPSSYYTARSLSNRASDLDALLDSMGQAVSTIKAATTSLETAAGFLEQASAVATQALEEAKSVSATKEWLAGRSEVSAIVSSKDELLDALDKTTGIIVIYGNIDMGNTSIHLKQGQSLVGVGYFQNLNPDLADAEIDKFSKLTWSSLEGTNSALYVEHNSLISDLSLTATTSDITDSSLIRIEGKSGVTLRNLDLSADTSSNTQNGIFNAVFEDQYSMVSLEGNINIRALNTATEFFGIRVISSTLNMGSGRLNIDLQKAGYSFGLIGNTETMNFYGNAEVNIKGGLGGITHNGTVVMDDYAAINISTTGIAIGYGTLEIRSSNTILKAEASSLFISNPDDWTLFNLKAVAGARIMNRLGTFTAPPGGSDITFPTSYIDDLSGQGFILDAALSIANDADFAKKMADMMSDNIPAFTEENIETWGNGAEKFNHITNQYDSLIEDAGYKGINLLQNQNLKVTFNESRSAWLDVKGKDASSAALGLMTATQDTFIAESLTQLQNALNQIRSMSSELGGYYNIVLNRQDFTENLINVLEEGADKLTLADMNEESANMLALQTRQQLATNSLSLASQAAQSILRLF